MLAELLHSHANRRAIHLFTVVSVGDGQTAQDVEEKKPNYKNQTMKEKFDQAREQTSVETDLESGVLGANIERMRVGARLARSRFT